MQPDHFMAHLLRSSQVHDLSNPAGNGSGQEAGAGIPAFCCLAENTIYGAHGDYKPLPVV